MLKEISPECSLEGLMLKLKLQYFGHLMGRADSLEKILMLGGVGGRRRGRWQRIRWLDGITDSMDMGLSGLWELVMDREAGRAAKSQIRLSNWTELNLVYSIMITWICPPNYRKGISDRGWAFENTLVLWQINIMQKIWVWIPWVSSEKAKGRGLSPVAWQMPSTSWPVCLTPHKHLPPPGLYLPLPDSHPTSWPILPTSSQVSLTSWQTSHPCGGLLINHSSWEAA